MSDPVQTVKEMYAAFGRGDVQGILAKLDENVSWEFEAPAELSYSGMRRGIRETAGFFEGIAKEHANPDLRMTEFVSSGDSVAAFGRYAATIRATGKRVDSPVAHLFKFRDGKVVRYVNMLNTAAFVDAANSSSGAAVGR
jgi:ketosteroid isomerase-like protein